MRSTCLLTLVCAVALLACASLPLSLAQECSSWTSCGNCVMQAPAGCGFCKTASSAGCIQATSATATACAESQWMAAGDPLSKCLTDQCSTSTSCVSCATRDGCSWCQDAGKCTTTGSTSCAAVAKVDGSSTDLSGVDRCADIDACAAQTTCSGCASQNQCGWCKSSNKCVATKSATQAGCSSSQWVDSAASCPQPSVCTNYLSCNTCNLVEGCGWCSASGSLSNGQCQPAAIGGSQPTGGYTCLASAGGTWSYQKCRPSGTSSCSNFNYACNSCIGQTGCQWCSSMNRCLDGVNGQTFAPNSCPSGSSQTVWSNTCPTSSGDDDDGGSAGPGGSDGAGGSGGSSGSSKLKSKSSASFALQAFILLGAITGWSLFGCMARLAPQPGTKASGAAGSVARLATNPTWFTGMIVLQVITFGILLAAYASDMWSTLSAGPVTAYFGTVDFRLEAPGKSERITYTCSASGTDALKSAEMQACIAAAIGAYVTLGYGIVAFVSALLSLVYAFQSRRSGLLSGRIWSNSGLALVSSLAALLCWALGAHLVLEQQLSGSGGSGLQFGPSWALMWPVILGQLVLTLYWGEKIRHTALPTTSIGVVMGTVTPGYPASPAPVVAVVAQPYAMAQPVQPVQGNPGFVAPQPVQGGFAQI